MQQGVLASAVKRNLDELHRASLDRTTLLGLERQRGISSMFLQVAYFALYNDYMARCMKVFDRHKTAHTFWWIYRQSRVSVDSFLVDHPGGMQSLDDVSTRLKVLRDKTHFHISPEGSLDPKAVWKNAGLNGKRLSEAVDLAFALLSSIQRDLKAPLTVLPSYYTPAHVHKQVKLIEDSGAW